MRVLFWSFQGGPAALIIRGICPSEDEPAGCKGVGLGVHSSSLHWAALSCSLRLASTDEWGENGIAPFSHHRNGNFVPTTLQESLTEE